MKRLKSVELHSIGVARGRTVKVHATLVFGMSSTLPDRIRPLRRTEYDQLIVLGAFQDEKIELLEGVLVPMSPIGPPHSSVVDNLTALLVPALAGRARVRI